MMDVRNTIEQSVVCASSERYSAVEDATSTATFFVRPPRSHGGAGSQAKSHGSIHRAGDISGQNSPSRRASAICKHTEADTGRSQPERRTGDRACSWRTETGQYRPVWSSFKLTETRFAIGRRLETRHFQATLTLRPGGNEMRIERNIALSTNCPFIQADALTAKA